LEFIKRENLPLKNNLLETNKIFNKKINIIKKECSKKMFEKLMHLNMNYKDNLYNLKVLK
jgi:hypothetical protein